MGLFRRKPTVDPAQLAAMAAVAAEVAELRAQLAALDRRLDATNSEQRDVKAVLESVHQRVGSIGTELTNQLTELSGDIDKLAVRPDPTEAIAAVDVLRTGQERLANEQARYQIAFREDLAAIADQLARKRA